MQNLLRFLYTYHHFIIFLFLELLALTALIEFNNYHQSIFFTSASNVTGTVYGWKSDVEAYLDLRQKNEALLQENLMLRQRDSALNMLNLTGDSVLVEDTAKRALYSYRSAEVINNSVTRRRNYFTVNKGDAQGIRKNMGVITPLGIAGKIVKTSKNYSIGMSLLHEDFLITPQINGITIYGGMRWEGKNPRELKIDKVNSHYEIAVGDTVYTTTYSHYFPPGVQIGTVSRVEATDANYQELWVKISNDIGQIRQVYIVQNLDFEELDSLENINLDERR